jgi:magnesium and cobalt transporter
MNKKNTEPLSLIDKIKKLFRAKPKNIKQFIDSLRQAKDSHIIDSNTLDMIEGVLSVNEKQVRDVMIPKPNMITVNGSCTPTETLPIITESGHSRFPVTHEDSDKITGILLAKDLLKVIALDDKKNIQVQKLSRPATLVPESKRLNILLSEFRQNKNHLAIVVDEFGSTRGLVTIEDLLEEIVGDISDEFDSKEPIFIAKKNDTTFTVLASTPLTDFNEHFHTTFTSENFDTLGGFLLKQFSYIPKEKEKIVIEGITFKISKAKSRGIKEVIVTTPSGV